MLKVLDQRTQANLHWIQDPNHVNGDNCNNVTREIIWGCRNIREIFDVLLTVHLSIFISVINQRYAQNFVLQ